MFFQGFKKTWLGSASICISSVNAGIPADQGEFLEAIQEAIVQATEIVTYIQEQQDYNKRAIVEQQNLMKRNLEGFNLVNRAQQEVEKKRDEVQEMWEDIVVTPNMNIPLMRWSGKATILLERDFLEAYKANQAIAWNKVQ